VAQQMAAEMPDRVRGLVLIDAATPREMKWLGRTRWFAALNPFYYAFGYHNPAVRRRGFRFLYYDPADITPELVEAYMSMARYKGHEEALARLARDVRRKGMARADDVDAPAVILWGAADRLLPPARGRWLQAHLRGSRMVVVPQASHQLPEEQPDVVNGEIASFVATLSRRKESA
jgi:pimeloyl-ACP methyl ester carboxylesterase